MGVGAGHSPEGLVPVAAMCPISFGLVCVHVPPQCRHLLDWNAKGSLGKGEKFKIPKSWRFGEIMSSSLPDFCSSFSKGTAPRHVSGSLWSSGFLLTLWAGDGQMYHLENRTSSEGDFMDPSCPLLHRNLNCLGIPPVP